MFDPFSPRLEPFRYFDEMITSYQNFVANHRRLAFGVGLFVYGLTLLKFHKNPGNDR